MGDGEENNPNFLNRLICYDGEGGYTIEGDPKHATLLSNEWGMDACSIVDTPMAKETKDKLGVKEPLADDKGESSSRRAIARIKYMYQDRADLSSVARVLAQLMCKPHKGCCTAVKRVIRYLRKYPRAMHRVQSLGESGIQVWTDSDWAGDQETRRSCSGGCLFLYGNLMSHWSRVQSVALSRGEAELNGAMKGSFRGRWVT